MKIKQLEQLCLQSQRLRLMRSFLFRLINFHSLAGLTQEEVAIRMGTTKSAVSRLESSLRSEHYSPLFSTLKKYAHACGKKLVIKMI